jgi:hypothetical protein
MVGDFKESLGINRALATVLVVPSFVVLTTLTMIINAVVFQTEKIKKDPPFNQSMMAGLLMSGLFAFFVGGTQTVDYLHAHFQIFPGFTQFLILVPSWALFSFISYKFIFYKRK